MNTINNEPVPVVAIDGPTASGKGTVAQMVATKLGFYYLDSGSLYRLVALAAIEMGCPLDAAPALAELAESADIRFDAGKIWLNNQEVTDKIRTEAVSQAASQVAAVKAVRAALLERQRAFARAPGLVADGRDMGSVVFPGAALKVFLTASPQVRAERRHKQLIQNGISAKITDVLQELQARDARDSNRPVAPLKHYPDAVLVSTDGVSAEQAAEHIVQLFRSRQG